MPNLDYPEPEFIKFAEEDVKLGKNENYPSFGFDNEYGTRIMTAPEF